MASHEVPFRKLLVKPVHYADCRQYSCARPEHPCRVSQPCRQTLKCSPHYAYWRYVAVEDASHNPRVAPESRYEHAAFLELVRNCLRPLACHFHPEFSEHYRECCKYNHVKHCMYDVPATPY